MDRAYVIWADVFGATRLTWYTYATGATLPPFAIALAACAQPQPIQVVAGAVQTGTVAPGSSPYANVADSAVLTFATALGNTVGLVIPGFTEALYLADNQTVDPAQPLVIALVAAVLALPLVDSAANPVIAYVGGLRQKRGY